MLGNPRDSSREIPISKFKTSFIEDTRKLPRELRLLEGQITWQNH